MTTERREGLQIGLDVIRLVKGITSAKGEVIPLVKGITKSA